VLRALATPKGGQTYGRQAAAHAGCVAAAVAAGLAIAFAPPALAAASPSPCPNEAQRSGLSAALPDCRAYEQVSPPQKGGFDATSRYRALPAQAAPSGEALAYFDYASFPGSPANTAIFDAHLATRTQDGWQTTELTPPKTESGPPGNYTIEYDFSEDLEQTVLAVPLQQLAPGATPGMYNLFLRGGLGEYSLLDTAAPLELPPGTCPESREPNCYAGVDLNAFAGASTSFQVIAFESTAQYGEGTPLQPSLYESALEGGQRVVRLVGVLPDGQVASEGSTAGAGSVAEVGGYVEDGRVARAVSGEGSQIVFEAPSDAGEPDEEGQRGLTEVYDRLAHERTVELSAPAAGAPTSGAAPAQFWAASTGGQRVFFTSHAELTGDANTGAAGGLAEDLYEYDFEAPSSSLSDLSADSGEAEGARVLGVLGASESGEYVYFVAEGELAAGAEPGHPNLYLARAGEPPVFVDELSEADARDWSAKPSEEGEQLESYVAPGGRHVAFAAEGEVYEYTAPGEEGGASGALACASCAVAGADALLGGVAEQGSTGTPFYQPRAVSEGGARVFFTAPDAAAGRGVYEYEHAGEGSCEEAAGCAFALSSPSAGDEDVFLDASANGGNVFFATVDPLASTDEDQLEDVYDARVEGGFSASPPPACEAGCRPAGSEAVEGPPILSAVTGASGNLPPRQLSQKNPKTAAKHHKKRGKVKVKRRSCAKKVAAAKRGKARKRALARCRTARKGSK
jgi:hypothetical protein